MPYIVVRIRGWAGSPWYIEETLDMLRLRRTFNAMIYPKKPEIEGMLRKVEPYITWGEINADTLKQLILNKRLLTINGNPLTDEYVKEKLKIAGGIQEFINKVISEELKLNALDEYIQLPIRLHPPSGGFKGSVKRPLNVKGEFGYRGDKINELVRRMM